MNSGQVKLNKDDVRNGIWTFVLSFIMLSSFSFLCLFMFYESNHKQRLEIEQKYQEYKDMQKRDMQLQLNMEEIYSRMSLISGVNYLANGDETGKILDKIDESKKLIKGEDSIKDFKHYSVLIRNFRKMIAAKENLNNLNKEVANTKIALQGCSEIMNAPKPKKAPPKPVYPVGSNVKPSN